MTRVDRAHRPGRYAAVPRTLTFLTRGEELLLLLGADDKPLFAGLYNGVGGHVAPGEDVLAAARREVLEETGLEVPDLELRGIVHVGLEPAADAAPGVLLFVFRGAAPREEVRASEEGRLAWISRGAWADLPLVEDLPLLLPRVLDAESGAPPFFALYDRPADGELVVRFAP